MRDGEVELARRIDRLDRRHAEMVGSLESTDPSPVTELLCAFVEEVGAHTLGLLDASSTAAASRPTPSFTITPEAADALVAGCHLLSDIEVVAPEIVTGPLRDDAQCWVSHGAFPGQAGVTPAVRPVSDDFVPVSLASREDAVGEKPIRAGLYTSTRVVGSVSMWWTYLHHGVDGGLFARPWRVWSLVPAPGARVREIASAAHWADFVCEYGVERDGVLCPDWRSAAAHHDAIHMTIRAVLATQGLNLATRQANLVAPYWDVESTLWLNWHFNSCELLHEVDAG